MVARAGHARAHPQRRKQRDGDLQAVTQKRASVEHEPRSGPGRAMRAPGQSPGCASAPPASLLQAAPVAVRWGGAAELGRQGRSSWAPPPPHRPRPAPRPAGRGRRPLARTRSTPGTKPPPAPTPRMRRREREPRRRRGAKIGGSGVSPSSPSRAASGWAAEFSTVHPPHARFSALLSAPPLLLLLLLLLLRAFAPSRFSHRLSR